MDRRRLRRVALGVLPLLVGLAVAGVASTTPASAVHGDLETGPEPPAAETPVPLDHDFRVGWIDRHRAIQLRILDGAACAPGPVEETSTAPARIEVSVDRPTGRRCDRRLRWWREDLHRPTVAERGQPVSVWVDGMRGEVHGYRI